MRETPNLLNDVVSSTDIFVSAALKKGADSILFPPLFPLFFFLPRFFTPIFRVPLERPCGHDPHQEADSVHAKMRTRSMLKKTYSRGQIYI